MSSLAAESFEASVSSTEVDSSTKAPSRVIDPSNAESTKAPVELITNDELLLLAKFAGREIPLQVDMNTQIIQVKAMLQEVTNVLMKRQKLLGLSNESGRPAPDEMRLRDLKKLRNPMRFILMGTPEKDIFIDPSEVGELPDVIDDLDADFIENSAQWMQAYETSEKLAKVVEKTELHFINQPRERKPLLVLDLDHTLLDFSNRREGLPSDLRTLKRPFMDAFLAAVYTSYDIAMWSQTSWRWVELKLTELGVLSHPEYKICFVMDKTSMFEVTGKDKTGKDRVHYVKPLSIIWRKCPHWSAENTVHVDDLGRNFALNPQQGCKIRPYHRTKPNASQDKELRLLAQYLIGLATTGSVVPPNGHENWRDGQR